MSIVFADLGALAASKGIRLAGAGTNNRASSSVASAGDVNGDGLGDFILGMDPQTAPTGGLLSAYLIFGRTDGWGDIDLGNLGTAGFRITGPGFEGLPTYGLDVSAAGDVNGDGYDDILIGSALSDSRGRGNNGASWVLYGKAGGFGEIDLRQPLGAAGARIDGATGGDYTGRTVASAGDVNGDGYADVVVGDQFYTSYGSGAFAGSAYVVFGGAMGIPNLDLASPGAAAWRIDGAPGDNIGRDVASAGDFNGDGLADIITAGLTSQAGQPLTTASAFVIFGKTAGFGTLNLANLGQGGFRIDGISVAPGTSALVSVGSAGDFNGDGFTDLLIGAPGAGSNGRSNNGAVYVVLGHAGGFGTIDLANPASYALRVNGPASFAYTGWAASAAGDVNGDGYADILLGGFNAGSGRGGSYVVLGGSVVQGSIDLAQVASNVVSIPGAAGGDFLGYAVAAAGDTDGDGFADILLGAVGADPLGRSDAGAGYVLFSQSQGGATYRGTTLADELRGTPDADVLNGYGQNDRLYGNAGNDTLIGGTGHDTLDGGAGQDNMAGGPGDDTYLLDDQGDLINELAGEGNDTAWVGAPGANVVGPNVEVIRLFGAATEVTGGATDEQTVANASQYSTLYGGGGADTLWGAGPISALVGGDGDDVLRGGGPGDLYVGGAGNDQYVVPGPPPLLSDNLPSGTICACVQSIPFRSHVFDIGGALYQQTSNPRLVEKPGEGIDTAWIGLDGFNASRLINVLSVLPLSNDIPTSNIEIFRLFGAATTLTGSASDEQIVANPLAGSIIDAKGGNDVLWGSNFADLLNGDNGDDILRGGFGADILFGGNGNDQFVITDNAAIISEAQGEGDDTAWVAVQGYVVGANVERINLSGVANTAIGNASDNIIAGNPLMGNTYLVGGGGNDTIFGSIFADAFRGDAGDDTLYSMGGADRFIYSAPGWGYDAINGFTQGQARLDFTGSGISFGQLAFQYANGNAQIEFGGSAILLFNVGNLTAGDFLF